MALAPLGSLPAWAAAGVAGYAADAAGVPLAWILGPMVVAAGFSIAGNAPLASARSRCAGQLVVGTAIGLNMTTEAALRLPYWLPVMVGTALLSILLSLMLSGLLARLSRVNRATAYFAILPGGLSEMANVGATHGARSEAISLSHALRVALAVILVPALAVAIDGHARVPFGSEQSLATLPVVLLLGAAALMGALVLRLVRIGNPWMLGALTAAGILSGSGLVDARLPVWILWAGQYLIGLSIGVRFKRDIVRRLPRFGLASAAFSVVLGALLAGVSTGLHIASGMDLPSLILALSPGGFAEMTLTAQSLGLDIALVTGFHFVRTFIVNSVAGPLWSRFSARA